LNKCISDFFIDIIIRQPLLINTVGNAKRCITYIIVTLNTPVSKDLYEMPFASAHKVNA